MKASELHSICTRHHAERSEGAMLTRVSSWLGSICLSLLACLNAGAAGLSFDTTWRQARDAALARAINPNDYECEPTDFEAWILQKFGEIGVRDLLVLIEEGALDWPAVYSLLLDNAPADQYIGVSGEYTREQLKRHKDNQRFWDVPTEDVQLFGMHGEVIQDDQRMLPAVITYFLIETGEVLSDAGALAKINRVQRTIERNTNLGYDHPLFTLNAFAVRGQTIPDVGTIPDKIVMGDGILEFFRETGLGVNAPDFVHAHEFAHHVQFELGLFDEHEGTPEATRRTELMADSFAAYYCAHARGATFQVKRFVDVMTTTFLIGDCAFDNPVHHGTPNQREAAAIWGRERALTETARGHILSAEKLRERFDLHLPVLVAPDAP